MTTTDANFSNNNEWSSVFTTPNSSLQHLAPFRFNPQDFPQRVRVFRKHHVADKLDTHVAVFSKVRWQNKLAGDFFAFLQ